MISNILSVVSASDVGISLNNPTLWRYIMKSILFGVAVAVAIFVGVTQVDAAKIHKAAERSDLAKITTNSLSM